jgi:KDO2-lipid IV(A) lauroyltransferase
MIDPNSPRHTTAHTFLLQLLARCPLIFLHGVGALLGGLAFLLRAQSRHQALAFARQANIPNAWWVVWQSYADFGRAVLEAPWIWLNPPEKTLGKFRVEIDPALMPHLINPLDSGTLSAKSSCSAGRCASSNATEIPMTFPSARQSKALLFLGIHLGCSEATMVFLSHHFDAHFLYQRQKNPWILAIRALTHPAHTAQIIPMGLGGVRALWRHLKNGGRVGIAGDQTPYEGSGVWVPFFGKPAYTMTLAPKISLQPGIITVHTLHVRRWGRFTLKITPMSNLPQTSLDRTAVFNRIFEGNIRQFPSQYRWSYDRFRCRTTG